MKTNFDKQRQHAMIRTDDRLRLLDTLVCLRTGCTGAEATQLEILNWQRFEAEFAPKMRRAQCEPESPWSMLTERQKAILWSACKTLGVTDTYMPGRYPGIKVAVLRAIMCYQDPVRLVKALLGYQCMVKRMSRSTRRSIVMALAPPEKQFDELFELLRSSYTEGVTLWAKEVAAIEPDRDYFNARTLSNPDQSSPTPSTQGT